MIKNSFDVNPQMWEYGGLRMNEVNFLKFCLYIKLLSAKDSMEIDTDYYNFIDLACIFTEGRPTVSYNQLWYYLKKWTYRFIEYGTSIGDSWISWDVFDNQESYLDTYLKIYNEVKEQVSTKPITIEMVMGYYNPKDPEDILPLYTILFPDAVISLSRIHILYRYIYLLYQEIKDNTFTLPLHQKSYLIYDYQSYILNELALKDKPKAQLPAIHAFERWKHTTDYAPIEARIKIKNKDMPVKENLPSINAQESIDFIDEFDKIKTVVIDSIPIPDSNINTRRISPEELRKVVSQLKEYANKTGSTIITAKQNSDSTEIEAVINNPGGSEIDYFKYIDMSKPVMDQMMCHYINRRETQPGTTETSLKSLNSELPDTSYETLSPKEIQDTMEEIKDEQKTEKEEK